MFASETPYDDRKGSWSCENVSAEGDHFLGSVVCLAGFTRWLLIDGQQRLYHVGIKQVSEHIWLVSFMDNFDHETCRLEPLDNPFGPKVLPMSPE